MIDINIKGVLFGIAAALPVFRKQGFGHFVNTASTAGHKTVPNRSVYSGTKFAVRAISEGLRQEAGDKLRVTIISPGFVRTNFAESLTNPEVKAKLAESRDKFEMPPDAIARAIAFAIEQPAGGRDEICPPLNSWDHSPYGMYPSAGAAGMVAGFCSSIRISPSKVSKCITQRVSRELSAFASKRALKIQPVVRCRRRRFLEKTTCADQCPWVCRKSLSGGTAEPQVLRRRFWPTDCAETTWFRRANPTAGNRCRRSWRSCYELCQAFWA